MTHDVKTPTYMPTALPAGKLLLDDPHDIARVRSKKPLEEYKELGATMRMYANLRFAQLTLFAVVNGGLVKFAVDHQGSWKWHSLALTTGASLLATLCFWIMEERAADHWHDFRRRSEFLEALPELSFAVYRARTVRRWQPGWFTATVAARLLLASSVVGWLYWFARNVGAAA